MALWIREIAQRRGQPLARRSSRLNFETLEARDVPATILGWSTVGVSNYGPSPFAPSTVDSSVTSPIGLTRGSGVGTGGTAAANAWGGTTWTGSSEAAAITANEYFTFGLTVAAGESLTLTSLGAWNARHSGTGPTTGALQYKIDSGNFVDISSFSLGSNTTATGNSVGAITLPSSLTSLNPGTSVTFRVPLWGGTNVAGTGYVNNGPFTLNGTPAPASSAPTVTTPTSVSITDTSATLGGTVASDGGASITARGVVYAKTSDNPNPQIGGANVTVLTDASNATGDFAENATGLTASTGYSFTAYATNSIGTTYTSASTFTTNSSVVNPPTVDMPTSGSITSSGAVLGGTIESNGGGAITARGVVYALTSDNPSPTLGGAGTTTVTDASTATGAFTETVTGLSASSGYSWVAYATNTAGTTYASPVGTFTTNAAVAPTVTAPTATSITINGASLGGTVADGGGVAITARGIVYAKTSDNANPTLGGAGTTTVADASNTTGAFTETVTGLADTTNYSFVAYATNSVGTTYTSPVSTFSTPVPVAAGSPTAATTVEIAGPWATGSTGAWSQLAGTNYSFPGFTVDDFSIAAVPSATSITGFTFSATENFFASTDLGGVADLFLATGSGATIPLSVTHYQAGNNALGAIDPQLAPIGRDNGSPIGQASYTPSSASTGVLSYTLSSADLAANPTLAYNLLTSLQTGSLRMMLAGDTATSSYEVKGQTSVPAPSVALSYSTAPVAPSVTTPTVTSITQTTATLGGTVFSDGGSAITARGVVYAKTSDNPNPHIGGTGVTVLTDASSTTGVFTENAAGLTPSTDYSFTAYVTNSVGTTYTSASTFTTSAVVIVLPTVDSPTSTAITGSSATLGGTVENNGGEALSARGIVYALTSVNPNPTLTGTGVTVVTDAATATGLFTENVTGLTNNSGYSFVAYATNSAGTAYSSPVSTFTTGNPSLAANASSAGTIEGNGPFGPGTSYNDIAGSGQSFPSFSVADFAVPANPTAVSITGVAFAVSEHYYAADDLGGTVDVYLATGSGASIPLATPVKYQSGDGLSAIDPLLVPIGLDAGGPIAQVSYTPSPSSTGVLTFTLTSSALTANPILAGNLLSGLQNGTLRFLLAADTAATSYEIRGYSANPGGPSLNITYTLPTGSPSVLNANNATVTVDEGSTANNSGTVSDPDGISDVTSVTASVGTVTWTPGSGTWTWSYSTTDGPANSGTVTITAHDMGGNVSTTTFALTVNNLPPTATGVSGPATLNVGQSGTYSLAGVNDPSPVDSTSLHFSFGTSPADLAADYNAAGTTNSFVFTPSATGGYTIYGMVFDKDGGVNTYQMVLTVSGSTAPVVQSFVVNNGDVQRSELRTITVNFASPVDAAQFQTAGAVTLTRTAGVVGTVVDVTSGLVVAPASGTVSSITLTFANVLNAGVQNGSLADGRWQLAVGPASYTSTLNDPTLRRLFGDSNNDGTVDGTDFGAFGSVFGMTVANSPFDVNGDGTVDGTDFGEFGGRFGYTI